MDDAKIKLGQLIARTWSDEGYKARLFEAPREVLREAGIDLPDEIVVRVVEQPAGSGDRGQLGVMEQQGEQLVLSLPRPPADDADMALEDESLEAVAGGICCCCCWSGWSSASP